MNKRSNYIETLIGVFVVIIASGALIISLKYSKFTEVRGETYDLIADFNDISGISIGSEVKISGIKVGSVISTRLTSDYRSEVVIRLAKYVSVPTDSSLGVVSNGIIGEKYLQLVPGADDIMLQNGEKLEYTRSSLNLEGLIDRFIVGGSVKKPETKPDNKEKE